MLTLVNSGDKDAKCGMWQRRRGIINFVFRHLCSVLSQKHIVSSITEVGMITGKLKRIYREIIAINIKI